MGVEAKAGEPFGESVTHKVDKGLVIRGRGKPTNLPERVQQLVEAMFGRSLASDVHLGQLEYQLLTAAAGTLVEARARRAVLALLLVHEFVSAKGGGLSPTQLAVSDFLGALFRDDRMRTDLSVVHGPIPKGSVPKHEVRASYDSDRFQLHP